MALSRVLLLETALASVVERLAAVEARIGHNGGPPLDELLIEPQSIRDQRLSKRALAERWGMSPRTIDRMRELPEFPTPDVVNKACVWWLSTIQKYERATKTGKTQVAHFRGQTGARHGPRESVSSEE
jgi:hypothetical protein